MCETRLQWQLQLISSHLRFSSGCLGSTTDAQPSLLMLFLNHSFACPHELLWSPASSGDHGLKTTAQGGALTDPRPLKVVYSSPQGG